MSFMCASWSGPRSAFRRPSSSPTIGTTNAVTAICGRSAARTQTPRWEATWRSSSCRSDGKSSVSAARSPTSSNSRRSTTRQIRTSSGNLSANVQVRGIEVRADAPLIGELSAGFDFTYNHTREGGSSDKLKRVPVTQAKAGADYHPTNLRLGASASLLNVGDLNDVLGGDISKVSYDDFTVLNLADRVFLDEKSHHRIGLYLNNVRRLMGGHARGRD
jgi:hypothetical protein